MRRRIPLLLVALLVGLVGCADDGDGDGSASGRSSTTSSSSTSTTSTSTTSTTAAPATTTTAPLPGAASSGEVRAVLTATGVVLPVTASTGPGRWRVLTPCEREVEVGGTPLHGATVVLDPGHGGAESGTAGKGNGLPEKTLNLEVSRRAQALLEAQGARVVLTRTGDYNLTLRVRAELAKRLGARLMVSVHHNGGADGPSDEPGTETYYQVASPESKRLAGLLYEETFGYFRQFTGIEWFANVDAGAKYRRGSSGDYYGILRHAAGVPTVLSEALFMSHSESEAALLARPEVQQGEAEALARAVRRFLLTRDPGSGYVEPIPRTSPAGPGGGTAGCTDPPLT